jgi:glycosyltransferase involved in cell wall biosynthesis
MDKVDRSMLSAGVVESRVIPNGVDLNRFRPGNQAQARLTLGLPEDAFVVLFSANGITANPWKDWRTIRDAIAVAAERLPTRRIILVGLGEAGSAEAAGRAEVRFSPFSADRDAVVSHYVAADVYLHAARADTFPNTVIEALACGVPVVATAVGGIPEQVSDLRLVNAGSGTGLLVPAGNPGELGEGLVLLAKNPELQRQLGQNAREDARERFDIARQAYEYLTWYREVLGQLASSESVYATGGRK